MPRIVGSSYIHVQQSQGYLNTSRSSIQASTMSCTPRIISRAATCLTGASRLAVLSPIAVRLPVAGPSRIPYRPRFAIRHATNIASSSSTAPNPGLPPISSQPSIRVEPPSLDAIKEEGFMDDDVELVPPDEARLVITQSAVQV